MLDQVTIERLKADADLLQQLASATTLEAAVETANSHGYDLNAADVEAYLDSEAFAETPLSMEQLAMVSGAAGYWGSKTRNGADQLPAQ